MSRRRKSVYSLPKLKLKPKTVVTIGTIISFILAVISIAALLTHSPLLSFWRDYLINSLGIMAFATPIAFILCGLVIQKAKWAFAQLNVLIGLITIMVALMGLFGGVSDGAGGELGVFIWTQLRDIITSP